MNAASAKGKKAASKPTGPSSPVKLEGLDDEQLDAVIAEAHRLKEERRKAKREEFLAAIRRKAEEYGVEIGEVVRALQKKDRRAPAADRRATVAPKYRNPQNASETWSGRGVKPKWMQALIAKGSKPDDFLIAQSSGGQSGPAPEAAGRF